MHEENFVNSKPIVLAFSGGLDTSVAVRWLRNTYKRDVNCLIVDIGQGDDIDAIAQRALRNGAADVRVEDAKKEFLDEYIFKILGADAIYEREYFMCSSVGRYLIAKIQIDYAHEVDAGALAHGATGKGNDQFRFEYSYASLAPDLEVIAPWRIWGFRSRGDLLSYAAQHRLEVETTGGANRKPLSIDKNIAQISYEG